ncbi:MAG: aminodeoxychorismate lyase [Pseudohongiellaceae bacterium]
MTGQPMLVDGKYQGTVESDNRGLAYGDGVFETILLHEGRPILLAAHLRRLALGCERLQLAPCIDEVREDIARLEPRFPSRAVLKVIVCRGTGGRGYRPDPEVKPQRILSVIPLPQASTCAEEKGIVAFVCRHRLALQPALAGIKHLNRLDQVLGSLEWPRDGNVLEGLMLDREDMVVEGTRSNIFWVQNGEYHTPDLGYCGINGVLRQVLMERLNAGNIHVGRWPLARLQEADEVFFCNSVFGVWPVLRLTGDEAEYDFTPGRGCSRAREIFSRILTDHGD